MFGKEHDKALRDICTQMDYVWQEFSLANFGELTYANERGRMYPKYNLTEEAFTLVVFEYNTKEAVQTKILTYERIYQKSAAGSCGSYEYSKIYFRSARRAKRGISAHHILLRENVPLFAVECDEISNVVKRHDVALQLNAYQRIDRK